MEAFLHNSTLAILAMAPRLLGEWWESDESNFSQVTLAMSRVQAMLNEW